MSFSKWPEQTRKKRHRIPMLRIHIGLNFENDAAEGFVGWGNHTLAAFDAGGVMARAWIRASRNGSTTKVIQRAAEEHWCQRCR